MTQKGAKLLVAAVILWAVGYTVAYNQASARITSLEAEMDEMDYTVKVTLVYIQNMREKLAAGGYHIPHIDITNPKEESEE